MLYRALGVSFVFALSCIPSQASARSSDCGWSQAFLSFRGDAKAQASCLLRRVTIGGHLEAQALPDTLQARVGQAISSDEGELRLTGLPAPIRNQLVATKSRPLSKTGSGRTAQYFVIHDTSSPYLKDAPFPSDLDGNQQINNVRQYLGAKAVAHYFVNRRGEIGVGHDFSVPWRATKLETQVAGAAARGRFLHVELLQPRRRDPDVGGPKNDRVAPDPGFGDDQYRTLAALYVLASVRNGKWLIPAFHAAIDDGLSDGHDDPQKFELVKFGQAIEALLQRPRSAANAVRRVPQVSTPPRSAAGVDLFWTASLSNQETSGSGAPRATARWGSKGERAQWTRWLEEAVETNGTALTRTSLVPADIARYCPSYSRRSEAERKLFWVGLLSSLSKFESNYNPATTYTESFNDAQGRRVVSRGLLQISQESANGYGCRIGKAEELHDVRTNLQCGVRILSRLVNKAGVVAGGGGARKWVGAAAYWSPFRRPADKQNLAAWVAMQPYCAQ